MRKNNRAARGAHPSGSLPNESFNDNANTQDLLFSIFNYTTSLPVHF